MSVVYLQVADTSLFPSMLMSVRHPACLRGSADTGLLAPYDGLGCSSHAGQCGLGTSYTSTIKLFTFTEYNLVVKFNLNFAYKFRIT